MTSWGYWTCPKCSRSWLGSIGYHGSDPREWIIKPGESESKIDKLLINICGCTGKWVTEEQMDAMGGVFTVMTPAKKKEEDND